MLRVFFRSAIFEGGFQSNTRQPIREQQILSTCLSIFQVLRHFAPTTTTRCPCSPSPAGLALRALRVTGKPPAPYRSRPSHRRRTRAGQPQATPAILSSRRRARSARRPKHSSPTSPPPSSPQAINPPPVASRSGLRHAPVAPRRSAPSSSPRRSPPAPSRPRRVTRTRRRSTTPA